MHERLGTDDSLLEVDGLADFAARLRDSNSSSGAAGGASGSSSRGREGQQRGWVHDDKEQDNPHLQPARYSPRDLPFPAGSSPPSTAPRTSASPTGRADLDSDEFPSGLHPTAARTSHARPSLPRPAWFESPPPRARPHLEREGPLDVDHRHQDSLRSATSYGHPPPFSPASTLPYPPPPPFVSPAYADPYAVAYPFDHSVEYRTDVRGDLGASSWSATTADVDVEHDAASEKGYAALPGPSVGEWHAPGGAYLHGVGFDDSHARGAAQPAKKSAAALERRREQLARKFGGSSGRPAATGVRAGARGARTEEEEATGVDAGGRLVTVGRRKRVFLRCAQAAGALLVGVCAIGAAFTHPVESADHPAPAPKGSAPHWALIVLPFLSLSLTLYLFALHPCLYRRQRAREDPAHGPGGAAPGALGVYPLVQPQQPSHSKRSWFGGGDARGGRGGGPGAGGGLSVNLVVDPRFLPRFDGVDDAQRASDVERRERQQKKRRRKRQRRREERRRAAAAAGEGAGLSSSSSSSSLSSLSSDDSDPWTASRSAAGPRDSTSSNPRRALLSHLSHEATWRAARSFGKRIAAVDFACCVVWGAVSVWAIGWAGKCTPGVGEGFCNLFNSAEACAVLATVAFASSFALDCFDLSRAKLSPRMRQQRLVGSV
ncbi:hypothetical protein JCM3775_000719 [Rhodotorula graminis]|uniref:Uncharacterized protein n=1 Tax=Rhodotorula graminis (strain WP1) TaxID=578459 RepID=A0A0P9F1Q2_RHOGW|nr:uncharacterized protein RHOBADRAFT_45512 [Rhodotorula graminis WP1]KPV73551.1 hypothetical protein RHOBADRAFT_45512 [Rhodotorula graminis WP1]